MKKIFWMLALLFVLASVSAVNVDRKGSFQVGASTVVYESFDNAPSMRILSFSVGNDLKEVRYDADGNFQLEVNGKVVHGIFSDSSPYSVDIEEINETVPSLVAEAVSEQVLIEEVPVPVVEKKPLEKKVDVKTEVKAEVAPKVEVVSKAPEPVVVERIVEKPVSDGRVDAVIEENKRLKEQVDSLKTDLDSTKAEVKETKGMLQRILDWLGSWFS